MVMFISSHIPSGRAAAPGSAFLEASSFSAGE